MTDYPIKWSDVIVTFTNGEVRKYLISAGPGIGGYLAREAGASGILSLFNHTQSWAIPLANIHDWTITEHVPVPNAATVAALSEAERGGLPAFASVEALTAEMNKADKPKRGKKGKANG